MARATTVRGGKRGAAQRARGATRAQRRGGKRGAAQRARGATRAPRAQDGARMETRPLSSRGRPPGEGNVLRMRRRTAAAGRLEGEETRKAACGMMVKMESGATCRVSGGVGWCMLDQCWMVC